MSINDFDRNDFDDFDELDAVVIDLFTRRRFQLERAGADSMEIAACLFAETGENPEWDCGYDDGGDWVA
ncbi:hypothetical protein [Nocardia arthritidis]|uniref:Uncharacterized protein n=1 Tax=Nocardia arthritidis TaxID=228602 RepID=A0A6G9Y848_9NOCA|nr:hypothetical protein [Nocardia arthritidis]QIS09389.1 hypothetical protein F5544_07415 [Nocardia arthritidis]